MEDHFNKLDEEVCLGYNRDARGNTLVGNWVEERALLDLAAAVVGVGRVSVYNTYTCWARAPDTDSDVP